MAYAVEKLKENNIEVTLEEFAAFNKSDKHFKPPPYKKQKPLAKKVENPHQPKRPEEPKPKKHQKSQKSHLKLKRKLQKRKHPTMILVNHFI